MKQHAFIKGVMYSLAILTIFFMSCEKDYYEPKEKETKKISDIFGEGINIPKDFDWSVTDTKPVVVEVDDKFNGAKTYMVEVLADNPIITPKARLLRRGIILGNETFETVVTYPRSNSYLYVRQTDPDGWKTVKFVDLSQPRLNVNFKTQQIPQSKNSIQSPSMDLKANAYTEPTRPADRELIVIDEQRGNVTIEGSKKYVIKGNYNGTITFSWGKNDLYLDGVWINKSSNSTDLNETNLIINQGGKLISEAGIKINNTSLFNYGSMEVKGVVEGYSNAQLINKGQLTINSLNGFQGKFFNESAADITNIISSSNNFYINNTHRIVATNLDMQGTIDNACLFIVKENARFPYSGTNVNISSGALFETKNLEMGGSSFDLSNQALLVVTENLKNLNSGDATFRGTNSGKALAVIEKIELEANNKPHFNGNLLLECSSFNENEVIFDNYASHTHKGGADLTIVATECNSGGKKPTENNGDDGGNAGGEQPIGNSYTYLFEDNWPNLGDYDMNDVVMRMSTSLPETNGTISELTIQTTLKAVGATKALAAAIMLDGVSASNIRSVNREGIALTGEVFTVTNGIEADQDYAVLPLFDDAHQALGSTERTMINTSPSGSRNAEKSIKLTVLFNTPVSLTDDDLNLFIINGGYKQNRQEIHLRGKNPTKKTTLTPADYHNADNLVWGIRVGGEFKYPLESVNIKSAYPLFERWITGDGASDWYKKPNQDKVYND